MQIFNRSQNTLIASQAQMATSLAQRTKGLLGRLSLAKNEAMVLKPCSSIHTFFMRFPIDVLFVDRQMRIIRLITNMPPNRLSPIAWASIMAIELPAGKIGQTNTQAGDHIEIKP